jgi:hypothetical protein
LAKDVKNELETALGLLSGKGKGVKGKGLRGDERTKMWEEVKALRKEYANHGCRPLHTLILFCCADIGNGKEAL